MVIDIMTFMVCVFCQYTDTPGEGSVVIVCPNWSGLGIVKPFEYHRGFK